MDLFKRKPKKELPPLLTDADLIDYHSVMDWLVGLGDKDYAKVWKVADIHRKSYQDAAGVLGVPNEPTTFITPPIPEDEQIAFLEDQPKAKGKGKNAK